MTKRDMVEPPVCCTYQREGWKCRQLLTCSGDTGHYCAFHRYVLREQIPHPTLDIFHAWLESPLMQNCCSDWRHYEPEYHWQLCIGGHYQGTPKFIPCGPTCHRLFELSPDEILDWRPDLAEQRARFFGDHQGFDKPGHPMRNILKRLQIGQQRRTGDTPTPRTDTADGVPF